jgi:hypothetical protein
MEISNSIKYSTDPCHRSCQGTTSSIQTKIQIKLCNPWSMNGGLVTEKELMDCNLGLKTKSLWAEAGAPQKDIRTVCY